MKKISIIFVCTGNICRSPTAEVIFKSKIQQMGLSSFFLVDSAGTHGYHIGQSPDQRSIRAAKTYNYSFDRIKSRAFDVSIDYENDYIIAMDQTHLNWLLENKPLQCSSKIDLLLNFDNDKQSNKNIEDPYYGGENGFNLVIEKIQDGTDKLIQYIKNKTTFL
jgi:protein-tyrosine phosphatase